MNKQGIYVSTQNFNTVGTSAFTQKDMHLEARLKEDYLDYFHIKSLPLGIPLA